MYEESRLTDSPFQNILSIFLSLSPSTIFNCTTILNTLLPRKNLDIEIIFWPKEPKYGRSLLVPKNQWCFSQIQVAAFQSTRYYSVLLTLLSAFVNEICCICFLTSHFYCSKSVKTSTPLRIVSMIEFISYKTYGWIYHIEVLTEISKN